MIVGLVLLFFIINYDDNNVQIKEDSLNELQNNIEKDNLQNNIEQDDETNYNIEID